MPRFSRGPFWVLPVQVAIRRSTVASDGKKFPATTGPNRFEKDVSADFFLVSLCSVREV